MGNAHQHGRAVGTGDRGEIRNSVHPIPTREKIVPTSLILALPEFSDLPTPTNMGTILISSVSFDTINSFSLILNFFIHSVILIPAA